MLRFCRKPALSASKTRQIREDAKKRLGIDVGEIATEWCFYIDVAEILTRQELGILTWFLAETFEPAGSALGSFLRGNRYFTILEIGPRLNFETAYSTTAVSICQACGLKKVRRLERALRIGLPVKLTPEQQTLFLAPLHDRMTQMPYKESLESFDINIPPAAVRVIPLIKQGISALAALNKELGLGMDGQDLTMWHELFVEKLQRNPTDVELIQLGQANSEHCRHGFFKGLLVINGASMPESLMEIVKTPWQRNPGNSILAFCDNSSALRGPEVIVLSPFRVNKPSPFFPYKNVLHPTLTAETHNHPSGIEPDAGAGTGTGGRIRDNQAVGRAGLVIAGGAAYCVDNLHIPGHELPWEDEWQHPHNLASPLDILIQASNGASNYGNCFGEPVVLGFTRSCGIELSDGRRGWFKPVMYTVGVGQVNDQHIKKGEPQKGMLVVQIGGPAYRIGIGGGSASSMITGENVVELDFKSVQRAAPEMEQRMNRVVRACAEMGYKNPIISIHDLGAGGDCNALPEIVNPAGARINLRALPVGDKTLSVLEIWGNESQERLVLLVWPDRFEEIKAIAGREGVSCVNVGEITGNGQLVVFDEDDGTTPVKLPLDKILGELPRKTFNLQRVLPKRRPLTLPENLTVKQALERVLCLVSVGSKRFLTTKVDRSVTGLIAQQQCVGPNQLTLSNYAVIAQSHFGLTGVALSLGEQPLKGLISPEAMARMAVAEALLNLAGARITRLEDIKLSANWMLAAKLPGEGAWLYDAARSLRDTCLELGIAIDRGKDSLSMAAKTDSPEGRSEVVKAPGELVVAMYCPMEDIRCKVTPDLKKEGNFLLFIDLAQRKQRLGGSALAQVFKQVGNQSPDMEDGKLLAKTFKTVQELIGQGLVQSIHDRSDGGLIVALLEMAFSGNVGLDVSLAGWADDPIVELFNEELGLIIEVEKTDLEKTTKALAGIPVQIIGFVGCQGGNISVRYNDRIVLDEPMTSLRKIWEETSSQIDKLQANPDCVASETKVNASLITPPPYRLTFVPQETSAKVLEAAKKPKVAILREQGSNGDREMASAFYWAGFEPWDVTTTDLVSGRINLEQFRGIAWVGGFSFADVLDAGKGWAGVIRFNEQVSQQFVSFYQRPDTFSLGVCNGCQLMALLGWVPWPDIPSEQQPRFIRNESERFESRFSAVKIRPSPAIMLRDMEDSILGIWVAHGEGRLRTPDRLISDILKDRLAPIVFVDEKGEPTEVYPFNPNASPHGITALCSPDGRRLAMMPHPERTFLLWQWPWLPRDWKKLEASPWLKLFQNAYDWCQEQR